ncbi:hypothetical protein [Enterobacter cloacae complex sp. I2]|uniref:hypothetical protein n=1 Tax=Enterobacter cloacae complex sp. I2 TaxID=2779603 RepID=UPI0018693D21|nr:hypothetical protein [Enterobacter cloacae complex sp. I2]MBE3512158.1 hypothetical protein [Enterobacter cloacae complex sp. I2]
MHQYTNEVKSELRESSSKPPYDEEFLAMCDTKTREEFEDFNKQFNHPVTYIFGFAVVGSITRNSGVIRNASGVRTAGGYKMERIRYKVVCAGSCKALFISDASGACTIQGASDALVGSMLGNGDEEISTPQPRSRLVSSKGDTYPKVFSTMPWSKH